MVHFACDRGLPTGICLSRQPRASYGPCTPDPNMRYPSNPTVSRRLRWAATSVLASFSLAVLPAQADVAPPTLKEPPGLRTIQAPELLNWAGYLASDELGGRLTGSAGQKMAAAYIAKHFEALGLEPLGDVKPSADGQPKGEQTRSFLQKYPLVRTRLVPQKSKIVLGAEKAPGRQQFHDGFSVLPSRKNAGITTDAEFVYGGLLKIRRYKRGVDLEDWTGKVPVLVIHAPKTERKYGIEQQMMMGMTMLGGLKRRVDRYAGKGAKAVVVCVIDDGSAIANMLTYTAIAPGQDLMTNPKAGGMSMGTMMRMMQAKIPVVFASTKISKPLLGGLGLTLEAANAPIDEDDLDALKTSRGQLHVVVEKDTKAFATNVVAILRGTDPDLEHEAVLYSAHMDHVGKRMDGDAYNGADDNASGSAGLMGIAKAFALARQKPRRSIIFLSVSGEELGLWGSAHYVKNPTWPIEDIVADINTDMIGRTGPESGVTEVTVTPSYRHRKFSSIVRDSAMLAEKLGLTFTNGDKYYQRSDHYNFAREGIPVVFFCNGEHEDYHQVSDHADKLDGSKMESISRLAYWTGVLVANRTSRPETIGRSKGWLK